MYLKTENVQALVNGHNLNSYQRSLAKKELERLITLLKDMEKQCDIPIVSQQSELLNGFIEFANTYRKYNYSLRYILEMYEKTI